MSKNRKHMPPADYIRSLLDYVPSTGQFFWRESEYRNAQQNARLAGSAAGTLNANGYVAIKIKGRDYYAHRLAYVHVHGDVLTPCVDIDHANRDKSDNRIDNLRAATRTENLANARDRRRRKENLPRGVRIDGVGYSAAIRVNHCRFYLGYFKDPKAAADAYAMAAREHHGKFARAP